jgi:hypothetical protein
MQLEVLFELGGPTVIGSQITGVPITPEEQCVVRTAQSRRRLSQRVEHGL